VPGLFLTDATPEAIERALALHGPGSRGWQSCENAPALDDPPNGDDEGTGQLAATGLGAS
jgi:hypothetical protein